MPTGCRAHFVLTDVILAGYNLGLTTHLQSIDNKNIDLMQLIGIEAECVSALTLTTSHFEVTGSKSPIFCSNVRGNCQIPFNLAMSVVYYLGIADSDGNLDKTLGYLQS